MAPLNLTPVVFVHGFASSAGSKKATYFRERFRRIRGADFLAIDLNPTHRDFEYQTTTGHINRLRNFLVERGLDRASIIASSYGGLVAVRYAHRFAGIDRMLLLAPALRWQRGGLDEEQLRIWVKVGSIPIYHEGFGQQIPVRFELHRDGLSYLDPVPPSAPVTIIHGNRDSAVPIADSRRYATEFPADVRLVEVDADHDLNAHLGLAWHYVEEFLLGS